MKCMSIITNFGCHYKCPYCIVKENNLPKDAMEETLVHEILHGIFVHLGYDDEASNEQFVQALANAINQTFTLREKS